MHRSQSHLSIPAAIGAGCTLLVVFVVATAWFSLRLLKVRKARAQAGTKGVPEGLLSSGSSKIGQRKDSPPWQLEEFMTASFLTGSACASIGWMVWLVAVNAVIHAKIMATIRASLVVLALAQALQIISFNCYMLGKALLSVRMVNIADSMSKKPHPQMRFTLWSRLARSKAASWTLAVMVISLSVLLLYGLVTTAIEIQVSETDPPVLQGGQAAKRLADCLKFSEQAVVYSASLYFAETLACVASIGCFVFGAVRVGVLMKSSGAELAALDRVWSSVAFTFVLILGRFFAALSIGTWLLSSSGYDVFWGMGNWAAQHEHALILLDTFLLVLGQPVCGVIAVWGLAGRVSLHHEPKLTGAAQEQLPTR